MLRISPWTVTGVIATAAMVGANTPLAHGQILTHAAFTEVATAWGARAHFGADLEVPERIDFSETFTREHQKPFEPPGSTFSRTFTASGFVETFGGGLPKIQFSITASQSGPKVALGGQEDPGPSTASGRVGYSVRAIPSPGATLRSVPLVVKASGGVSSNGSGMHNGGGTAQLSLEWWSLSGDVLSGTVSQIARACSIWA